MKTPRYCKYCNSCTLVDERIKIFTSECGCYNNKDQQEFHLKEKQKLNNYAKNKRKTSPKYRISQNIRNRLGTALRLRNKKKVGSSIKELGCSIEYLLEYLGSKFQEGMSWDNYGEWHIDHIKPLASFNLENIEEFKKACHYTNLQPLWAEDNLKKDKK